MGKSGSRPGRKSPGSPSLAKPHKKRLTSKKLSVTKAGGAKMKAERKKRLAVEGQQSHEERRKSIYKELEKSLNEYVKLHKKEIRAFFKN